MREKRHLISRSKEAKIGEALFENILLIIWFHWPNPCLSKTGIRFFRDNYIRKSKNNSNRNNPGTDTPDTDKADNPSTAIPNLDRAENPGIRSDVDVIDNLV